MASQPSKPSSSSSTTTLPPTLTMPSTPSTLLDLHTSLLLTLWPALTLTISIYTPPAPSPDNPSPASSGSEIRDWLSGSLSSMLQTNQLRDRDDVADVLEQVLSDEFEVVIEDGSLEDVAGRVWWAAEKLKAGTQAGRETVEKEVAKLWEEWVRNRGKTVAGRRGDDGGEAEDGLDSEDDGEEEDDNDDDEMEDVVPDLVDMSTDGQQSRTREKVVPEVDDEGFTKVVRGKRR